jgi:hypothetical protein
MFTKLRIVVALLALVVSLSYSPPAEATGPCPGTCQAVGCNQWDTSQCTFVGQNCTSFCVAQGDPNCTFGDCGVVAKCFSDVPGIFYCKCWICISRP